MAQPLYCTFFIFLRLVVCDKISVLSSRTMATYADECAGWSGITEHKAPFVSSTQLRSHAAAASSSVERDGSNKHFHADHAASRHTQQSTRPPTAAAGGQCPYHSCCTWRRSSRRSSKFVMTFVGSEMMTTWPTRLSTHRHTCYPNDTLDSTNG